MTISGIFSLLQTASCNPSLRQNRTRPSSVVLSSRPTLQFRTDRDDSSSSSTTLSRNLLRTQGRLFRHCSDRNSAELLPDKLAVTLVRGEQSPLFLCANFHERVAFGGVDKDKFRGFRSVFQWQWKRRRF